MSDIATVIRLARAEPSTENLEQMWRRVFGLPAWYLLPSASEGPATPLVARLDEGDFVLAFTHLRPINAFADDAGMKTESGDIPMLTLTPAETIEHLEAVVDHVDGLVFNAGTDVTFRAPVAAVRQFAERFRTQ